MIYVFALIKKKEWFKLLSRSKIETIDVRIPDSTVDYQATYVLQDEEWFKLEKFNKTTFSNELCETHEFNTTDYDSLSGDFVPSDINALAFISENIIGFQRITNRKVINNKFIFSIRGDPDIKDVKGVILDKGMDAVFDKRSGTLYFRDLSKLTHIFPGIVALHREADESEMKKFFGVTCSPLCELEGEFSIDDIKKPNRKKIAYLIDDEFESVSDSDKMDLVEYCNNNDFIALEKRNGKFLIQSDEKVTMLINALSERYYVTRLKKEKREVRAFRKV